MSFWRGGERREEGIHIVFEDDPAIFSHLRTHFGDPPRTARFEPMARGGMWVIAKQDEAIIGCIRYRYVDEVDGEAIHLVDCFCVHPAWRGRGYASAMLCALRDYATPRGMPRAIFLKEGAPLPMAQSIGSGLYQYRACHGAPPSDRLTRCPTPLAHRLVRIRQSLAPDALILLDCTAPTQDWWIYWKGGRLGVIACIQDTHQRDLKDKKMGWFTAWIVIDSEVEAEARNAIADALRYGSVWFPSVGNRLDAGWMLDGAFHWYAYQWNTTKKIDPKVYVMVI